MNRLSVVLLGSLCLGGCATAPLLVASPDGRTVQAVRLQAWLKAHPLQADQETSVQELGRTESASFHLVQVRTKEQPHVHKTHDLVAVVQQGHGTLFLGSHRFQLVAGSLVNIPRGVVHYFVNEAAQPAVAFVVFSPPFDGTDSIPVTEGP